jgi:predicted phosphodiesterase
VLGNADAWMLTGIETADEGIPDERLKKMGEIRLWSLSQLTEDDREFIANFQATVTLQLPDQLELLCFHGSPTSFDDVMIPAAPQEVFENFLGSYADKILTGGHTHAQQIRDIGNHFFFNPGSVGRVPWYDQVTGNIKERSWAEYAILNAYKGQISLEFRRIPFDVNELINIYRTSGRPFADEAIAEYQK